MLQNLSRVQVNVDQSVIDEGKHMHVDFGKGSNIIDHPQRTRAWVDITRAQQEIEFKWNQADYGDVSCVFYIDGQEHPALFIFNNPVVGRPSIKCIYNDNSETRTMDFNITTDWEFEGRVYTWLRVNDDADGNKCFIGHVKRK